MLYLNEKNILVLKPSWKIALEIIEAAISLWANQDFTQPIKPYLRFRDPQSRIIAMPAFIGSPFDVAGLKWIASFPSNVHKELPRAHSITVLNDSLTGKPLALINSSLISGIRTAAVSAFIIHKFLSSLSKKQMQVGILGLGPIGKLHIEMVQEILGDMFGQILVYDNNPKVSVSFLKDTFKTIAVNDWKKAYSDADIFITCTTSVQPYIDILPKPGSLHLNVSLRDYHPEVIIQSPHIIVDDWEEVCRENTDIEKAQKKFGLEKSQTQSLKNFASANYFDSIDWKQFSTSEFAMFHPMGMGIFDIAFAKFFYDSAIEKNLGLKLDD